MEVKTEESDTLLNSEGPATFVVEPEPKEEGPGTNEEGLPAAAVDDPRRTKLRILAGGISVLPFALFIGFLCSGRVQFWPYDMATTSCDTIILDLLRNVVLAAAFFRGSRTSIYAAHSFNVLCLVGPLTAKLWVYTTWASQPVDTIAVVAAPLSSLLSFVFTWQITTLDTPNRTILRFKSMMTILKPYFNPHGWLDKVYVVLTYLSIGVGKACSVVSPIFLGRAVTNISATPPQNPYWNIGIYIILQVVPNIASEIQDVLYVKVWQVSYTEAAELTFRHLHSLSLDWHLRKKMGNALRSMDRGLEAADVLMTWGLVRFVPTILSAFAAFIVFAVHFEANQVSAVCHAGLALYCWATYAITVWRSKYNEELNVHDNDMHEKATDSLINFETVKYFTNEEFETHRYVGAVRHYQRMTYTSQWATSVVNVAQSGTIQLCLLGALMLSAHKILEGEPQFGPGQFVAIQTYVITIFAPLQYLGIMYTSMINALINMQNLSDLLNEKADIKDIVGAKPLGLWRESHPHAKSKSYGSVSSTSGGKKDSAVEFEHVCFRYPSQGPGQGLKDISFKVPAGTTTAVVGHTGCGKTTLSRLLFRFYDVLGGTIRIGGEDISKATQLSLRQVIGMVPQDTCMFNDTIRFNIAYGSPEATDEELEDAARRAQVLSFVESLPARWDTVVGERGLKLSGGEKQRIAIARCLLKNPPIVVLDEATSALDNKTERDVQSALRALEGRTTLIIAHRLTTIQHANQIIVLKDGRILEKGTHMSLMANETSSYRALWQAQAQAHEEGKGDASPQLDN